MLSEVGIKALTKVLQVSGHPRTFDLYEISQNNEPGMKAL